MAITLKQMASLVDDPSLKEIVAGAALAVCKIIKAEDPKPTEHASKMKLVGKVYRNPLATPGGDSLAMVRVVLSEFYNTPKMAWNADAQAGQSNLVFTATDEEIKAVLAAAWYDLSIPTQ